MITELLDAAIDEVMASNFEITEFQLGEEPMEMFITEIKATMSYTIIDIQKVRKYKSITVREHPSKDAVMYSLSLKERERGIVRNGYEGIG